MKSKVVVVFLCFVFLRFNLENDMNNSNDARVVECLGVVMLDIRMLIKRNSDV
jgi:hypothetical protein